jgi:hypothetical protein
MALPPLTITKDNWRKTGVTLSGSGAGKGDRIPATGQNLDAYRKGYDGINWSDAPKAQEA